MSNSGTEWRKILSILLITQILFFLMVSCKETREKPNIIMEKPNIILIVPDALRAKQLPVYGYNGIQTPHINSLAKDSVLLKYFFVKSPGTISSFSCFFSGLLLPSNGLRRGEKTLAQYLKESGYHTVGIVSSRILWAPGFYKKRRAKNQFNRGFDDYIQDVTLEKFPFQRKSEKTTQDVLAVLENLKEKDKPFFLFVHYMDPHAPYTPSYDKEIEKIDGEVGKVIEKLKELKLYKKSLLIFTSDHGESLGDPITDHGSPKGHGWFVYTEQIHVPFIVKFPNNQYKKTVAQVTRNIDLMPTILDYAGIKYDKTNLDGESLLPAIQSDENLNLVSLHQGGANRVCPEGSLGVVLSNNGRLYHFIKGRFSDQYQELFDITEDPEEQDNLAFDKEYSDLIIKAKAMLDDFEKKISEKKESRAIKTEKKDKKEIQALKALGYVSGGAPAPDIISDKFLMQKTIPEIGQLKYSGIIRQPKWGIKRKDKFFPIKIISAGKWLSCIIANRNRELIEYHDQRGFRSTGIEKVIDIAYSPTLKKIVLLQKDGIHNLNINNQKISDEQYKITMASVPVQFLYVDFKGNIYIFTKQEITKLDDKKKIVRTYDFQQKTSSLFAVDYEENIYIAQKNSIFKFNKDGNPIKSFVLEKNHSELSCIFIDRANRLWALEKLAPIIHIFNLQGKEMSSFRYNIHTFDMQEKEWHPVPTRQIYFDDKLYLLDNWEGILVYSLL